jgi:hypothetical protein
MLEINQRNRSGQPAVQLLLPPVLIKAMFPTVKVFIISSLTMRAPAMVKDLWKQVCI